MTVSYQIEAQRWRRGQFTVPVDVQAKLGVSSGDLYFKVWSVSVPIRGQLLFEGWKPLKSGPEIYGPDIRDAIQAGQLLDVDVSTEQF